MSLDRITLAMSMCLLLSCASSPRTAGRREGGAPDAASSDGAPSDARALPDARPVDACTAEPAASSVENGGACTHSDQCIGIPKSLESVSWAGFCHAEENTGYPGGTCYTVCAEGAFCPEPGVCVPADGVEICMQGCTSAADCRQGWGCFDPGGFGPEGMLRLPFCYPDCTEDTQCSGSCPAATCNPWSGRCEPTRGLSHDGGPCESADDCESGLCATEADGFPGGACFSMCKLSANDCPIDLDDGIASPCQNLAGSEADLGVCDDGCDDDADCRTGYTCRAVEGGAVCWPPA